jgi:hypothetical protein
MKVRWPVTLSNENGLSRSWPSPDTPLPACAGQKLRKAARRGDPYLPQFPAGRGQARMPSAFASDRGRQARLSGNAGWRSTISARRSGRW